MAVFYFTLSTYGLKSASYSACRRVELRLTKVMAVLHLTIARMVIRFNKCIVAIAMIFESWKMRNKNASQPTRTYMENNGKKKSKNIQHCKVNDPD